MAKGSQKRIFVGFFLFFRRATEFVLTNWPMLIFLIEIKPYKHNCNSKDTGTGTERGEDSYPSSIKWIIERIAVAFKIPINKGKC